MFYGISHADLPVSDLARAERDWTELMGLRAVKRGDGFIDLDSGALQLRLVAVPKVEHTLSLRVSVRDVPAAYATLCAAGLRALVEPMHTPALELVATVADADGHRIVLWRDLTEDEYGFTPELPKEGEWQPDAETLLKSLLSHVPALFRALARRKVTRVVEELADQDRTAVTREHVIRGYILASAKITRYRLVEPLRRCGIDPDRYREEFEA